MKGKKWMAGGLVLFVLGCSGGDDPASCPGANAGSPDGDGVVAEWLPSAHVTLAADKTDALAADGENAVTLTLTVADATGRLRPGVTPSFQVSGSDNAVGTPAPTDAFGSTKITLSSTKAEVKTVTASIEQDGMKAVEVPHVELRFVAGSVKDEHSSVSAGGTSAKANGTDEIYFNVTLRDAHDNAIVGGIVELKAESKTVATAITTEIGTASPAVTSIKPGTMFVSAYGNGVYVGGQEVTFDVVP